MPSLFIAEKTSPVGTIGGVDSIINKILESPKYTINTMQETFNQPKVAKYLQ